MSLTEKDFKVINIFLTLKFHFKGVVANMTEVFQANLLETHKMALDKATSKAVQIFEKEKNTTDFNNKTEEIKVYRTFICEYKQLMEEW